FLPRFYFVYNYKLVNSNVIEYMKTTEFNPKNEVILIDKVNFSNGQNSSYKIEVLEDSPNRIKLSVNTGNSGFLVFSDSWYPGWRAFDDGKKTEVYRANYIQKVVFLESGGHEVEFIFKPKLFDVGKYLSLIGLILIIMIIIISIRKRA
ncbi:MAG TPA: YfhO family protein, partial [Candidatus Nanoarchaeia archaeon]|nr:YfhO family protein [Candidatus Nanoarchaeia archaeon]